jgi:hypothetical protein
MVIKRIAPVSIAKVAGVLYALLGVLLGGIFSLVAMAGGAASRTAGGAGFGAVIGVGAIVFFPILYGCVAFVFALIGAWLYNVAGGWVGGVEIDLE